MKIVTLSLGQLSTNAYLVVNNTKAALIDPAGDCAVILAALQKDSLVLEGIYLTHGHADHVSAAMELKRATGAKVFGHTADSYLLGALNDEVAAYLGLTEAIALDEELVAGATIQIAGIPFVVLTTPGHTPGSCCFYDSVNQLLFSGDTLFAGSIGRSDLLGGNARVLQQSLNRLKELPDATKVFPGHGPSTTIERERVRNRYW